MTPLYRYDGGLLKVGDGLANDANCCCTPPPTPSTPPPTPSTTEPPTEPPNVSQTLAP